LYLNDIEKNTPEHSTMTAVIQAGDRIITSSELIPLLTNYQMLSRLVAESIIDEAIEPIKCTPKEIETASQQFALAHHLTTNEERLAWLHKHQLNLEQFIAIATRNLRIEKFKQAAFGDFVRHYFFKNDRRFDRVIYSIIWVKDVDLAQEIYFRISENEQSFAELARQYSQGAEAQFGGLVGPVEFKTLPPALKTAFSVDRAEGTAFPVRMGEWMAVLRLEKYLDAQLDEPTQQRILNELFQNWLQQQLQEKGYQIEQVENYWKNAANN
jgi:parvulin-like peptidyl-prolyl isomerase